MELQKSSRFAALLTSYREAYEAFANGCDIDALDDPTHKALSDKWHEALDALLAAPADTVAGIGEKLDLIEEREIRLWHDWPKYRDALERDLLDLRRPAATIHEPFTTWRAAREAHELCTGTDEEASAPCDAEGEACRALFAAPCASSGDFLVKAYVTLLGECGSRGGADLSGNIWDVDIEKADHPKYLDEASDRSACHDLEMTDLGACLLAFGRLEFSARDWMVRAAAVGLPVRLNETENGAPAELIVGMHDAGCDGPVVRERTRLRRILAFDPDRRNAALCSEILTNWPDLLSQGPVYPEPE